MSFLSVICISSLPFLLFASKENDFNEELQVGDKAPLFKAQASFNGKEVDVSLQNELKSGAVVVYFYPSAYTKGCDIQAATFSKHIDEFKKAGATVLGISADDIQRLNDFSADPDYCAGKFTVISDADGKIAESFGLKMSESRQGAKDVRGVEINHGFIPRVTFVIDKNGIILKVFSSEKDGISPAEHVTKALEIVQNL